MARISEGRFHPKENREPGPARIIRDVFIRLVEILIQNRWMRDVQFCIAALRARRVLCGRVQSQFQFTEFKTD